MSEINVGLLLLGTGIAVGGYCIGQGLTAIGYGLGMRLKTEDATKMLNEAFALAAKWQHQQKGTDGDNTAGLREAAPGQEPQRDSGACEESLEVWKMSDDAKRLIEDVDHATGEQCTMMQFRIAFDARTAT